MQHEFGNGVSASRAAHPASQGGFPQECQVRGINGVIVHFLPRFDFERSVYWLLIQSGRYSVSFDAASIDDLIDIMTGQIQQKADYRQYNFVFRRSTLSVVPSDDKSAESGCIGLMFGGVGLYLDAAGVVALSSWLRQTYQGFEQHAKRRGLQPPSQRLRLVANGSGTRRGYVRTYPINQ